MHVQSVSIRSDDFPTKDLYPFSLEIFHATKRIVFNAPVTFFIGENGTGKTTLLKAMCYKCGIYIWGDESGRTRYDDNPYEKSFYRFIDMDIPNRPITGAFFSSQMFLHFSQVLDEWATSDPGVLDYFGGKSLLSQSHGQSLMSFFASRFEREGIYFLDEPETGLSPKTQIEFVNLIAAMAKKGHAQFIIATHSPILLACPDADILNFNSAPIQKTRYEETEYFSLYKSFMLDKDKYINQQY